MLKDNVVASIHLVSHIMLPAMAPEHVYATPPQFATCLGCSLAGCSLLGSMLPPLFEIVIGPVAGEVAGVMNTPRSSWAHASFTPTVLASVLLLQPGLCK